MIRFTHRELIYFLVSKHLLTIILSKKKKGKKEVILNLNVQQITSSKSNSKLRYVELFNLFVVAIDFSNFLEKQEIPSRLESQKFPAQSRVIGNDQERSSRHFHDI